PAMNPATAPKPSCWMNGMTVVRSGTSTSSRLSLSQRRRCWSKMALVTSRAALRISKRVSDALSAGEPVVALESTVVTHGLPRPRNLKAAEAVEAVVAAEGAVPATVGVIGGDGIVGLEREELRYLADSNADKASLWNLASIVARRADAGTTVATTLHAAALAGIDVFATGGIGGVHDSAFDESADLEALAN